MSCRGLRLRLLLLGCCQASDVERMRMHVRACRCKNAVLRRCLGLNACVGAAGLGCWEWELARVAWCLCWRRRPAAGGSMSGREGMAPGW